MPSLECYLGPKPIFAPDKNGGLPSSLENAAPVPGIYNQTLFLDSKGTTRSYREIVDTRPEDIHPSFFLRFRKASIYHSIVQALIKKSGLVPQNDILSEVSQYFAHRESPPAIYHNLQACFYRLRNIMPQYGWYPMRTDTFSPSYILLFPYSRLDDACTQGLKVLYPGDSSVDLTSIKDSNLRKHIQTLCAFNIRKRMDNGEYQLRSNLTPLEVKFMDLFVKNYDQIIPYETLLHCLGWKYVPTPDKEEEYKSAMIVLRVSICNLEKKLICQSPDLRIHNFYKEGYSFTFTKSV